MAARNRLTAKTVAHPVLLPSGEKGRSVHVEPAPHRAKESPGDWHIRPYSLNERANKLISRVAPWRGISKKRTVRSQISFGSFRRLGATDDGVFGRP